MKRDSEKLKEALINTFSEIERDNKDDVSALLVVTKNGVLYTSQNTKEAFAPFHDDLKKIAIKSCENAEKLGHSGEAMKNVEITIPKGTFIGVNFIVLNFDLEDINKEKTLWNKNVFKSTVLHTARHEITHLIARNGWNNDNPKPYSINLGESVADTFATLCGIKDGTHKFFKYAEHYNKARLLIAGTFPYHYTTPSMQEAEKYTQDCLKDASYKEIKELAEDIADKNKQSDIELKTLSNKFNKLSKSYTTYIPKETRVKDHINFAIRNLIDGEIYKVFTNYINAPDTVKFIKEKTQKGSYILDDFNTLKSIASRKGIDTRDLPDFNKKLSLV